MHQLQLGAEESTTMSLNQLLTQFFIRSGPVFKHWSRISRSLFSLWINHRSLRRYHEVIHSHQHHANRLIRSNRYLTVSTNGNFPSYTSYHFLRVGLFGPDPKCLSSTYELCSNFQEDRDASLRQLGVKLHHQPLCVRPFFYKCSSFRFSYGIIGGRLWWVQREKRAF